MPTLDRIRSGPLEAIALADGELRLVVVPGAGMIGCSLQHRGEELLVQRGGLDGWRGTGRSFGLPLLHPWANRLRGWRYACAGRSVQIDRERGIVRADAAGLPIHGALAAAEDWDLLDVGADGDAAWLRAALDYGRRDDRLAVFPFPHRLELELRLAGDALTVVTTLVPTGAGAVPLAWGWHPWLRLPGVARRDWELAQPERVAVELDAHGLPTGQRAPARAVTAPLGARMLDDHCDVAPGARFALRGGGRELAVEWVAGYRHAQVFAPAELDVVCLEPMMAPVAALSTGAELDVAQPGERVSATFRLTVRDDDGDVTELELNTSADDELRGEIAAGLVWTAAQAEPPIDPPAGALREIQAELAELAAQREKLPLCALRDLDTLDQEFAHDTDQRAALAARLAALPAPQRTMLGRTKDPHAAERAFLVTALNLADRGLAELDSKRERLTATTGNLPAARDERDALDRREAQLQQQTRELFNQLADRDIAAPPAWARDMLGERPDKQRHRERWERGVRTISRYRHTHDLPDEIPGLGPEPTDRATRSKWQQANRAVTETQRLLGRSIDRGRGLGLEL